MKSRGRDVLLAMVLSFDSMMTAAAGLDDSVTRCQAIEDPAVRLRCFDELLAADKQAAAPSVSETAGTRQSTNHQKTAVVSRDNAEPQIGDFPRTLEVASVSKTIDDRHIFYLRDGSVWQEVRNGPRRFDTNRAVTIARSKNLGSAMFASYWMEIDGAKFKVIPLR
jgi:hypothetical protein